MSTTTWSHDERPATVITSVRPPLPLQAWDHYILAVEADPAVRHSHCSALRAAGIAAIGMADGPAALRLAASQRPDAVVLDLAFQRLNGLAVLQALRENPDTRDIPVIAITGADTQGVNVDHIACLLRDPVAPANLIVALRHVARTSAASHRGST